MPILSQAIKELVEGAETNAYRPNTSFTMDVVADEATRARGRIKFSDDIVRYSGERRRDGDKEPHSQRMEIYNISPIDNPFCSMSRTIQATGKIHEWTEDALQPTTKNAAVEGAESGADQSAPVTELQNYCQIMTKDSEITGTMEIVDKYGRDSEMALGSWGALAA